MKKLLRVGHTLLIICFGFFLCAQQVEMVERAMSEGNHTSFMIEMPGCDVETAEEVWKKIVDAFGGKTSQDRKTGQITTEQAAYPGIGGTSLINVYAKIEGNKSSSNGYIWFKTAEGYLGEKSGDDIDQNEISRAKRIVENFAQSARMSAFEKMVETERDNLEDLRKDFEKLQKDHTKLVEEINECRTTIEESKAEAEVLINDKESMTKSVETLRSEGGAEKELKRMEKDLKKIEKNYDNAVKAKEKCEQLIEDNQEKIKKNAEKSDAMVEKLQIQRDALKEAMKRSSES
jgi:hypothetical protein